MFLNQRGSFVEIIYMYFSPQALVKTKEAELSGASEVDVLLQKLEQLMTKVKNTEAQFVLNNTGNNLEEIKKQMKQQEENDKSITSLDQEVNRMKQSVENYLSQDNDHSEDVR